MVDKRRLQDENPERAGEVDPTKPQFTPLLPPFPRPAPLEFGEDPHGKTIEDCRVKFDNMKPFTGHPFIPPILPPDGGSDQIQFIGIDLASDQGDTTVETEVVKIPCPECGGEGWVMGTRPSPEPEYERCATCDAKPLGPDDWCSDCGSAGWKISDSDWLKPKNAFTLPCPECGEETAIYSTHVNRDTSSSFTGPIFFCEHGDNCPGRHQSAERALTARYPSGKN